jgi:hypothetical protein
MTAPNIVGVTTFLSLANTNSNGIVSNPADSNYVYKINSIIVANDGGSTTRKVTVNLHSEAAGAGTSISIAKNVGISSESTLVVLDKASSIYLEENKSISISVCSYETIVD